MENNQVPIAHLLLIDPGVSGETAFVVQDEYERALQHMTQPPAVHYFAGDRAYDGALQAYVDGEEDLVVGAIGALNFGWQISTHAFHRNIINTMVALVEAIAERHLRAATGSGPIYVVQAFQDRDGEYHVNKETAGAFAQRFAFIVNQWTRMHEDEFYSFKDDNRHRRWFVTAPNHREY